MKKKIFLFLAVLWILCSFLLIKATYAKYLTTVASNTDIGIAGWKIVLNTQDIMENSDFSNNLDLIFPGNDYYEEDTIVPGAMRIFRFKYRFI